MATKSHWPISVLSTISSLFNMLMPLVLVRILSPDDIGLFKIFFLYLTLAPAFFFTTGIVNGISYWAGRGQKGEEAIQKSAVLIYMITAAVASFTFLLRFPLCHVLGWSPDVTGLFALGLVGSLAGSFYEESSIARGQIWTGAIFGSGIEVLRAVAIVATAVKTHSLQAVFLAHGIAYGLKAVLGYVLGFRSGFVKHKWDPAAFTAVWKYALPVSVAWVFGVVINYSDQLVLSKYISTTEFAFYSIGCLTVPPLIILEASIARVLIPQLSSAFSRGKSTDASHLYRKAVDELSYFVLPCVTGMFVFAEPVIRLLFTERYVSATPFMRVYAFYYLFLIIPNDAVPRARGESKWILGNFITFSILTLLLCWSLAHFFGAFGALTGLLVSRFAIRLYAVFYIRRSTDWQWSDFLPFAAFSRSLSVCLLLGGLCVLAETQFSSSRAWFIVCGGVFSVLYFALTIAWNYLKDGSAVPIAKYFK